MNVLFISNLPDKRLYIFENIDHIITAAEYIELGKSCSSMSESSNVWFIFTSSIDGYVYVNDDIIEDINIINNDIYQMPSVEQLLLFLEDNYPIEKHLDREKVIKSLKKIINKIDDDEELLQPFELVLMKLINDTNLIHNNYWKEALTSPEMACLSNKHVV